MSQYTLRHLRIFAASPNDVALERAKLESIVASLKPLADFSKLSIEVVDFRTAVPDMGRPQKVILDQLQPATWDIFVGILWHRFGTPSGGRNLLTQQPYLSGTEEEFHTAYSLWKRFKRPRVMLYRCMRQVSLDALDVGQYAKVREFFAELDGAKGQFPGLYQTFETTEGFEKLLLHNLQRIIIDHQEQNRSSASAGSHAKPPPTGLVNSLVPPTMQPSSIKTGLPEMDFYETQTEYVLEFALPGSESSNLEILLEGTTLTIRGKLPLLPSDAKCLLQERLHGPYARSVTVPPPSSYTRPEAAYVNGLLKVVFPKSAQAPPASPDGPPAGLFSPRTESEKHPC